MVGALVSASAPASALGASDSPQHEGAPKDEPSAQSTSERLQKPVVPQDSPQGATTRGTDQKSKRAPREVVPGLWGRPVRRGGFHLQIVFGVGGGPDTLGLFHDMELGYTFGKRGQHTVALLHTFIQNRGMMGTDLGGPDLIGGWMVEYKHPLFFPDLVWKVALGLGGTHDQSGPQLKAHSGFGAAYGLDLHVPLTRRFGPTLTLLGMNVTAQGQHHFGVALGLGFTLF